MDELTGQILIALQKVRDRVVWRPHKAQQHLERRIDYGHLPQGASLADYEELIAAVVADEAADVYAYLHGEVAYAVAVAVIDHRQWLVMVGLNGVMETAFAIDREGYTEGESWRILGKLGTLENE